MFRRNRACRWGMRIVLNFKSHYREHSYLQHTAVESTLCKVKKAVSAQQHRDDRMFAQCVPH